MGSIIEPIDSEDVVLENKKTQPKLKKMKTEKELAPF